VTTKSIRDPDSSRIEAVLDLLDAEARQVLLEVSAHGHDGDYRLDWELLAGIAVPVWHPAFLDRTVVSDVAAPTGRSCPRWPTSTI
jgi:hypothetical protein